jgi:histidyl-tRNA synthetase
MVTKQMYTFTAPDEQSYTLRPEGTASIVRSYLEHHLSQSGPVAKLFYIYPIFRYEAPQAGRYRQHHQCGIEMLGAAGPEADAAVLALARDFLKVLGIEPQLHLNSLGTKESRGGYIQQLRDYLEPHRADLSEDSQSVSNSIRCASSIPKIKRPSSTRGRAATAALSSRTRHRIERALRARVPVSR